MHWYWRAFSRLGTLPPASPSTSQHTEEVAELIAELAAAGSAALGVTLESGVQERLLAYARSGVGPSLGPVCAFQRCFIAWGAY